MTTKPYPNHLILAASTLAARHQCEMIQYPVLKDVHYFDKHELEFITLVCTHDVYQVFDPNYVPGTQEEQNSLLRNRSLLFLFSSIASRLMW